MHFKVIFCGHLYFRLSKNSETIQPTGLYSMNQKRKIYCDAPEHVVIKNFLKWNKIRILFRIVDDRF